MTERTCSIEGCERQTIARGWCQPHWARWRRNGDPGPAEIRRLTQSQGLECSVDGCSKERSRGGLCGAHYQRQWRTGDTGPANVRDWSIPVGCKVDGCDNSHDSNGYCSPHSHRLRKYGDPTHVPSRPKSGDPKAWRSETVSYLGAHNRVRRLRGNAKTHACQHCGQSACDWAYDHQDLNESYEVMNGYQLAYSADPSHYMPLCKPCHVRFDT